MHHEDKVFFRNFFYTVAVLAITMIFFLITALTIAIPTTDEAPDTTAVDERTKPVGQLRVADEAVPTQPAAPAAPADTTADTAMDTMDTTAAAGEASGGAQVYDGLCVSCHGTGIPGIPQLGDAAAWQPRIDQGMETLYSNAITGFVGTSGIPMPARGGNPELSDDDVKAAVDYMLEAVK